MANNPIWVWKKKCYVSFGQWLCSVYFKPPPTLEGSPPSPTLPVMACYRLLSAVPTSKFTPIGTSGGSWSYSLESSLASLPSFVLSPLLHPPSPTSLLPPCRNAKIYTHTVDRVSRQTNLLLSNIETQTPLVDSACTVVIDGFMNWLRSYWDAHGRGSIKSRRNYGECIMVSTVSFWQVCGYVKNFLFKNINHNLIQVPITK